VRPRADDRRGALAQSVRESEEAELAGRLAAYPTCPMPSQREIGRLFACTVTRSWIRSCRSTDFTEESRTLRHGVLAALVAVVASPAASAATADDPLTARAAATACDDYANQAEAQRAKDTSRGRRRHLLRVIALPMPAARSARRGCDDLPADEPDSSGSCTKPKGIQRLVFDKDKYPNIHKHFRIAVRKGWPRRLIVNRPGGDTPRCDRVRRHRGRRLQRRGPGCVPRRSRLRQQ
jgi:hypothetical protein